MATRISLSNGFGIDPITVPDGMPHDELLLEMERMASECDAIMGDACPRDMTIVVRAWPYDRFRVSEVVELRHKRQGYSSELVAELIAEDYR